jgi:hypothetical protein
VFVEARALFVQTIKEGMKTWLSLAALAAVLSALAYRYTSLPVDPFWLVIVAFFVFVAAGVNALGLENRARTYRFLAHHGVRPGLVWLVKVTTWMIGVSLLGLALLVFIAFGGGARHRSAEVTALFSLPLGFAIAVICGMAFRRGITACVIAVVLSLLLSAPLATLAYMNMLPWPGWLVVTAALLAVSWMWRAPWILDQPAPGRWLRLGTTSSAVFALLFGWYIGARAWSVPDVGPIAPPAAWSGERADVVSTENNAALLYREAAARIERAKPAHGSVSADNTVLSLVRRAAAQPYCRFDRLDRQTLLDRPADWRIVMCSKWFDEEARQRLARGDLAASWDDIMVLFRMSRHVAEGAGVDLAILSLIHVERSALAAAIDWAVAPGQTPERLRAAVDAYNTLPLMASPGEVARAEANIVENTLNLPHDRIRDYLVEFAYGPSTRETDQILRVMRVGSVDLVTTPWELARARRVNRRLADALIRTASRKAGHRLEDDSEVADVLTMREAQPDPIRRLAESAERYLLADEQQEVARRALVQILAIRIWQLKHAGAFPESLEKLVSGELPNPPEDPYSGRPFGYIPSNGQMIIPLQSALSINSTPSDSQKIKPVPGSWLLYSVGIDRKDDKGLAVPDKPNYKILPGYDIVFAIPPIPHASSAAKGTAIP